MSEIESGSSQSSAPVTESSSQAASQESQSVQSSQSSSQSSEAQVTSGTESTSQPGATTPPVFAPNFKFKAAGKEHEIPEYLRSVVKDATAEKQLKELHEKAYGLDLIKTNYQTAQQQLQQFQKTVMPEYQNLKKTVDSVVMYRNNGDLDSVFESIGIQPQAVAKWMYTKLQLQEMPPEQRSVYENEQQLRKQNYALQEKLQTISQTQEQNQLQARATELQTALAKPDVMSVAEAFNTRVGQPDAFWNFVCQQADYMEKSGGQRVDAEQAVQHALKILGTTAMPAQAPVTASPVAQAAPSPTPPVIPNVQGGRNSSPTRKVAKSVDDLRKLASTFGNSA